MKADMAKRLVAVAAKAGRKAHCPYSRFHVGAALLTADGEVVTGCNVENASFGLTVCAERVAFGAAVAAGYRRFKAIAIVADGKDPAWPCGACLQVMTEFCGPEFVILVAPRRRPSALQGSTLGELLPKGFRFNRRAGR